MKTNEMNTNPLNVYESKPNANPRNPIKQTKVHAHLETFVKVMVNLTNRWKPLKSNATRRTFDETGGNTNN